MTIVTWRRDCIFGEVMEKKMILNDLGKIVDECWLAISEHFPNVELGAYLVMPNHVHGIIYIHQPVGATRTRSGHFAAPPPKRPNGPGPGSLGAIVGSFKSAVTKCIGRELNAAGIWQRNYYDHIIRDGKDLQKKTNYIEANPSLWDEDENNPLNNVSP